MEAEYGENKQFFTCYVVAPREKFTCQFQLDWKMIWKIQN